MSGKSPGGYNPPAPPAESVEADTKNGSLGELAMSRSDVSVRNRIFDAKS